MNGLKIDDLSSTAEIQQYRKSDETAAAGIKIRKFNRNNNNNPCFVYVKQTMLRTMSCHLTSNEFIWFPFSIHQRPTAHKIRGIDF